MSATNRFRIAFALFLVAAYVVYSFAYPTGKLRYRMNVEIVIDGKRYAGSGVIEVRFRPKAKWMLAGSGVSTSVNGQAIVLESDSKGLILVLLTGPPADVTGGFGGGPAHLLVKQFDLASSVGSLDADTISSLPGIDAKKSLSASEMPAVLHLSDPETPASARLLKLIDPEHGPKAKLLSATIETTRDPITDGIEEHVPWVRDFESAKIARQAMAQPGHRLPVLDPRELYYGQ